MRLVMLVDRRTERSALDSLIASARGGLGSALVLRGEPGIGKTALLEYAIESASGFRIARAGGVESEMELAFAALHQLCAPALEWLDRASAQALAFAARRLLAEPVALIFAAREPAEEFTGLPQQLVQGLGDT